jgi:hypothetical protein
VREERKPSTSRLRVAKIQAEKYKVEFRLKNVK